MRVYTLSSFPVSGLTHETTSSEASYSFAALPLRALAWPSSAEAEERPNPRIPCACFNIRKASRAISQLYDEALQPVGLRGTQYSLLTAISYVGHEGIGVLADVLSTDRTTLSRNLRPLVERGWADPLQDADGRKRTFQLTPAGRKKLDAAIPLWEAAQQHVAESLGADSLEALRALADNIVLMVNGKQ